MLFFLCPKGTKISCRMPLEKGIGGPFFRQKLSKSFSYPIEYWTILESILALRRDDQFLLFIWFHHFLQRSFSQLN